MIDGNAPDLIVWQDDPECMEQQPIALTIFSNSIELRQAGQEISVGPGMVPELIKALKIASKMRGEAEG